MNVIDANGLTGDALVNKIKAHLENIDIDFTAPSKSFDWYEPDFEGEVWIEDDQFKIQNLDKNMAAYASLPSEITLTRWLDDDFEVQIKATLDDSGESKEIEFEGEPYQLYEFYKLEVC